MEKLLEALMRAKPHLDAYFYDAETGIEDGTYEDREWFKKLSDDMSFIEKTLAE